MENNLDILAYQNDIRAKAKKVRISGMESEDIFQEVVLHLLQVRDKFNPVKSSARTFVSRVATNKIRDLIRRSRAQKRSLHEVVSLDALLEAGLEI
jgi:RNA polymerase sigma factor (sigma-70 family)